MAMFGFLFVLGFILFMPYYAQYLEDRLRVEGVFRPLDVKSSFRLMRKGRLLWGCGLILILMSLIGLTFFAEFKSLGLIDIFKVAVGALFLFLACVYGHYRSAKFNTLPPNIGESPLMKKSVFKAAKDFSVLMSIAVLLLLINFTLVG